MMASRTTRDFQHHYPVTHPLYQGTFRNTYGVNKYKYEKWLREIYYSQGFLGFKLQVYRIFGATNYLLSVVKLLYDLSNVVRTLLMEENLCRHSIDGRIFIGRSGR